MAALAPVLCPAGDPISIPNATVSSSSINVAADTARRTLATLYWPSRRTRHQICWPTLNGFESCDEPNNGCCSGSWGVTLGLAYAQAYPDCVSEAVFFSITAGCELDWVCRTGQLFPKAWECFRNGVPLEDRDGDLADAYARLLVNPDPTVH
jgi:hypothetical protein